jgi:hypothetical protein
MAFKARKPIKTVVDKSKVKNLDEKKPLAQTLAGEKKHIHAFIATPAYDGRVLTDFAVSIAETCQVATMCGIQITATIMGNGAFIDLARNTFVRMFLDTDCTHLFFIDADLKWEPRAFVALVTADLPVCAGAYPKRSSPEEYPVHLAVDAEGGMIQDDRGWIMCDRVPTGFLCIERSVIEKMVAVAPVIKSATELDQPRLFYTYINEESRFVGEDFAWCRDYCKQFDAYIPVWPDFDFTHGVTHKGNWHQFLTMMAEDISEGLDATGAKRAGEMRRAVIAGPQDPAKPV